MRTTVTDLGLPPAISALADEERGLILLTGTTGSGKSTTLAAIIDQINETKSRHIVTIEDPIEYLHTDRSSIINQREVGMDTASFKRAMRRVLRQDPDVILIGEMRDEETVRSALSAAETGHLVLSTVHTLDAPETVNRIIDFFPLARAEPGARDARRHAQGRCLAAARPDARRQQPRRRLRDPADDRSRPRHDHRSRADRAAARGDPGGRVLRHADVRPGAAQAITRPGRVSMEDALRVASSPHDFKLLVAAEGRTSTSMADLADAVAPTGCQRRSRQRPRRAGPSRRRAAAGARRRPAPRRATAPRRRPDRSRECPGASSLQFVKHCARIEVRMASNDTCPVCRTAEIVCGKWTLLVIRDLAEGRSRFCELERSLQGISPRTLSLRLRALEEEGIVERQTFPEVPPRVEYALTEKGRALVPLIEDMRAYGRAWLGGDCERDDEAAGGRAGRPTHPRDRHRLTGRARECESPSRRTS